MKASLFYALVATSVAVAVSAGSSALVLSSMPQGGARSLAERYLIAPGGMLYERLQERKQVKKIRKTVKKAAGKIQDGIDEAKEKLEEAGLGAAVDKASEQAERLPHYYNVATWAVAGFAVCLLMTLFFGVSSIKSWGALYYLFKVGLALVVDRARTVNPRYARHNLIKESL